MREVAERAGVSTSTVSHVINGTRHVRRALAIRVQSAMVELGYQPNAVARSLRRKETRTLGMVLPDSANPFFAALARAIEDVCSARGYSLILTNSAGDSDREIRNVNVLLARQVDGLIFVAADLGNADLLRLLTTVPVVVMDRELAGSPLDSGPPEVDAVMIDNLAGGYTATRHLIDLGHQRIACVTGYSATTPSGERVVGFRKALVEAGLPVHERLIVRGDFGFRTGYLAAQQLLSRNEPPTAIFACNDQMAIGVIAAAVSLGVRVPEDLSVVGFDGIELGAYTLPPLTTMAQPISRLGQLAAELLLTRLSAPKSPVQRLVLTAELVIRKSTAVPQRVLRKA
ncbi:MAG TPA: LacI family DNA-binding transcriptional regulator, partial [Anaerolineae bacterium]